MVAAELIAYRPTEDSDYYAVLRDAAGNSMIVELAHPDCSGDSPFMAAVVHARQVFGARLQASASLKTTSLPVRVHGNGYFDDKHGQTGVAPNGIELHPVLRLEFERTGSQVAPGWPLKQ